MPGREGAMPDELPRIYTDLAPWFHLLTAPSEYDEEAEFYRRALRYLQWTWDPDHTDSTYLADFAYLLREEGQPPRCVSDRHVCGLFGRADWLRLLGEVGFRATIRSFEDDEVGTVEVFVATRPDR
jgi:hypothetical protein